MMIRSAKMNATTPPKLIPPFHSTAASGTLPIEQTKLSREMTGPMSGPHSFGGQRVPGQEQVPPEAVRHPGADRPGDQQADDDVADDRGPLHHEDVRHEVYLPRTAAAARSCRRTMLMSIAAWPSMDPASPLSACSRAASISRWRTNSRNSTRQQHDHDRAADELGQGELPGDQQRQDDAELDDQVGAGDLEGHRGGEAGALAEQRAGQRHGGVGARRRRRAEAGGHGQRLRPVIAEQPDDGASGGPPPGPPPTT